MTSYKYEIRCRDYDKAGKELQRLLDKSMQRLVGFIKDKEDGGEQFEKIFNNEVIKHNVLSERFFTFKTHGPDSSQLRLLYEFQRKDNEVNIVLHKFFVKRRQTNEYLTDFKEYVKNYSDD